MKSERKRSGRSTKQIRLPGEVGNLAKALAYIHGNARDTTLTMMAPFWLSPSYIVAALPDEYRKSQLNHVIYTCHGTGFDKFREFRNLVQAPDTVDRCMNEEEMARAKELLNTLREGAKERVATYSAEYTLIDAMRSTAPFLHNVDTGKLYVPVITHFDEIPTVNTGPGKKWFRILTNFAVKDNVSLHALLTFFRFRAKSNINMLYRVMNHVKVYPGDACRSYTIADISAMMGPAGLLNEIDRDDCKLGAIQLRRASEKDVPRRVWKEATPYLRRMMTVVSGPGIHALYVGRTLIQTGTTSELNIAKTTDELRRITDGN